MKPRERELAAIRHQVPDRIPIDAICVENIGALSLHLGLAEHEVLPRLGLDGRIAGIGYAGGMAEAVRGQELNEWGASASGVYGTANPFPPLAGVSSAEQIERHAWPDPARYDYAASTRAAAELSGTYAVRGPYWQPLFCRVCSLTGMEEALVWMLSDPALFEAVLDQVFQRTFELCRNYVKSCGEALDIFYLGDDFASQRGMLFDPKLWRRYLRPRYARLFALAKRAGKPVWFHSCGDITAILPDLIDIGMDVWETVQLHSLPVSPAELKRTYGRHITFFGAINTQRLPFATPAQVTEEVNRCIDILGKDGGYICGPDHHIKPDVPPENTLALFDTATRFRKPGYTQGANGNG